RGRRTRPELPTPAIRGRRRPPRRRCYSHHAIRRCAAAPRTCSRAQRSARSTRRTVAALRRDRSSSYETQKQVPRFTLDDKVTASRSFVSSRITYRRSTFVIPRAELFVRGSCFFTVRAHASQ